MKQPLIILVSLVVGFGIGRFSVMPSNKPSASRAPAPDDYSRRLSVDESREATQEQTASRESRAKRSHETGGSFKIDELAIRIGIPIVRKTTGGETCFTLPFEFENLSEGRIYSPQMTEFEVTDNFGNKCGTFYPASKGMWSGNEKFLGKKLVDNCEELLPGQSGVRYYNFEFAINSASNFKLNSVWQIADNTSYWDTERHRIDYRREFFVEASAGESP